MATTVKSKGTALLMSISAVYTAIPLLKSISISGAESQTYPSSTLDGTVYEKHAATGYTTAPTISADGFRDPDDSTQAAFLDLLGADAQGVPKAVPTNFKITYADTTPLSEIYSGVGFGFDTTVAMSDGLACTYKIQTSGAPS